MKTMTKKYNPDGTVTYGMDGYKVTGWPKDSPKLRDILLGMVSK